MSDVIILDASAILAYLQEEKGADILDPILDAGSAQVTTVNYCEVLGKLIDKGMPPKEAQSAFHALGLTLIDFDQELATQAATLRPKTNPIGSSLGDRACLALAQYLTQAQNTSTVYTADHSWTKLKWPFKVVLIRPPKAGS